MIPDKQLFYNQIADKWEGLINNRETSKRLDIVFNDLLSGIELKNKKFLEVGCGLGYFSQQAYQKSATVTGVDIGPLLVQKCQNKIPMGNFLIASADKLPFKQNTFDITLCTEVVEHLQNQEKAIEEITRVTKPKGYIVLTTPNLNWKFLFNLLSTIKIRPYQGIENWLNYSQLRTIFIRNNLLIKKEIGFNFIYPHPILNKFERISQLKPFMINIGYTLQK